MPTQPTCQGTGGMRTAVSVAAWSVGAVVGVLFFRSVLGGRINAHRDSEGDSWLRHRAIRTCRLHDWARLSVAASSDVSATSVVFRVTEPDGSPARSDTCSLSYCPDGRLWAIALPPLDRGWSYRYTLVAEANGRTLRVPRRGDLRARFEGSVSPLLIVAHVVPTLAAAVFLFMAFHAALLELFGYRSSQRHRRWLLVAVVLFALGAIGVGGVVSERALGDSWGGWPLGRDVTDTKSEVIVLYWLVLLACTAGRARLSQAGTLVGVIGTMILYLLPHGGVT